tara:strand:+ start:75 stop:314 length:240 start_codon:yes stop_codon:yes gene_type:complete
MLLDILLIRFEEIKVLSERHILAGTLRVSSTVFGRGPRFDLVQLTRRYSDTQKEGKCKKAYHDMGDIQKRISGEAVYNV